MAVGIPLGILVGLTSGSAFVICLRAAFFDNALKAACSLLSMPASWFGGGWLTSVFDLEQVLDSYVISLAGCLLLICGFPLMRAVVRIGNEIGET